MASSPPQLPHPCARTAHELSVSLSALCQSAWGCQPRGAPQPEGITKPWRQIHSELWWTCDHDDTTCPPPTQPLWQPCSWSTLFCTPLSLLPLCTGLRPPGSPGRQAWSLWSLARLTTQDMGSPRVVAAPHPHPTMWPSWNPEGIQGSCLISCHLRPPQLPVPECPKILVPVPFPLLQPLAPIQPPPPGSPP